jgi:hypothetical protein
MKKTEQEIAGPVRHVYKVLDSGAKLIVLVRVVARDGIEPPTPAFSGLLTD